MVRTPLGRVVPAMVAPVVACAVICAPVGSAEPENPLPDPETVVAESAPAMGTLPASGAESSPAPGILPAPGPGGNPVEEACALFAAALNVAAANYDEFAYASAGSGDYVNYRDPDVAYTNVVGRTALRQSATAALSASRTPGLPPDVSDPMRSWSLRAAKLMTIMGLRRGGDSLNDTATALNADADQALMACAANKAS